MYYINIFSLFSILGYIFEIVCSKVLGWHFSSLFFGPWIPLYGLSVLISIFIKKKTKSKISFLVITYISITILETITGYICKYLYDVEFWNYSNLPLHIGDYGNLLMSLIWVVMIYLVTFKILPKIDKYILKVPKVLGIIFGLLIMGDFLFNSIVNLKTFTF